MTIKEVIPEERLLYDSSEEIEKGTTILESFYIPILSHSKNYKRLTGYFSSHSLTSAARGLEKFIANEGRISLITGHVMTKEDLEAIERGETEKLSSELVKVIKKIPEGFEKDHISLLSWLVAKNRLEIKIAIVDDPGNPIFHKKIALFKDEEGNQVVTHGSLNESRAAYIDNDEEFAVYRSWVEGDQKAYFKRYKECLEKYFKQNRVGHTQIISTPEAIKKAFIDHSPKNEEELAEIFKRIRTAYKTENEKPTGDKEDLLIKVAPPSHRWRHQEKAVNAFLEKKHGILEMATGTGKTMVAYKIINQLFSEKKIDRIIISTYGNDLLKQWYDGLNSRLIRDILIFREFGNYHELPEYEITSGESVLIINWQNLRKLLRKDSIHDNELLICDEVHGFGSDELRNQLSGKVNRFEYRLGLSATPEREYDEAGNSFIENEIGPTIYKLDLQKAIKRGILCEFEYTPIEYELTEEDSEKIRAAYAKYSKKIKDGENPSTAKIELYMDLARVRKLSKGKIPRFIEFLNKRSDILDNCIIFVETKEYGKLIQDIIIHHKQDYHTYYHEDDSKNLFKFAKGDLKLLITCKRISQGIDIKSIKNIILFSSSRAKLETTQRIGRCLRTHDQFPEKKANVIDFIALRPQKIECGAYEDTDGIRRRWLERISNTQYVDGG